jgi:predicted ATPase/DNA-binding SARP family transcriptional activator
MAPNLRLFGAPEVDQGGSFVPWPVERRFQLLAFLACRQDWVDRAQLAALFWPEQASEAAFTNMRKVVHRTREIGWLAGFEASGTRVRWLVASDLTEFDAAVTSGKHDAALRLYRGPLLEGFERGAAAPYLAWLRTERQRCAQSRRQAALAAIGAATDAPTRLALAEALLVDDPLDEEAVVAAVQAHRLLGASAEANRLLRAHAERLGADLGVEPSARLRALSAGSAEGGTARAQNFVGRRLELRQLDASLHAANAPRLLLLHGPGGVGKSRLAREALRTQAAAFADGAHWIALDDLADAAQVPPRIAQVLGLQWRDSADGALQIARLIAGRQALLVLDNAEHLSALGALTAVLLDECPRLRLLATSRTRLEQVACDTLALEGLALPDEDSSDAEAAATFDAVRLFSERAAFHLPSFSLAAHVGAVIDIVRQVQGLPLAIEMAAAWVRLLPPQEIARELRGSIDILTREADAAALGRAEHASMQATIERSWALLAPAEREVLSALSVFVGGFMREAAQAVAGATLPLLATLVDKSLVQADRQHARFDLHPLVAAFALKRLDADTRRKEDLIERHRAYFADWLKAANATARADAGAFRRRLDPEFGNCAQAWQSAAILEDVARITALAGGLANYLENCGRYDEGATLLAPVLQRADDSLRWAPAVAQTCRGLSALHYRAGQHAQVEAVARRGIRAARLARDGPALKACLNVLGLSLWIRNQFAQALPYFERALRQAEQDRDRYGVAVFAGNIGLIAREIGQFERALVLMQTSLAAHRDLGNARGAALSLNNIGNHFRLFQDWTQARLHFGEGLALIEQHGLQGLRASFVVNLGLVDLACGALEDAERRLREVLALRGRGAEPYLINAALLGMAQLALRRGDPSAARQWLAEAIRDARAQGGVFHGEGAVAVLAELRVAEGNAAQARALLLALLRSDRTDATVRVEATRLFERLFGSATDPGGAEPQVDVQAALDQVLVVHGASPPPLARNGPT